MVPSDGTKEYQHINLYSQDDIKSSSIIYQFLSLIHSSKLLVWQKLKKYKLLPHYFIHLCLHSFHWHMQNVTIPCRSQELLPFHLVIYFFLPPFSTNYSFILPHFILPSVSWSTSQSCYPITSLDINCNWFQRSEISSHSYRDHLETRWNTVSDHEQEITRMVSYYICVTFLPISLYMNVSYIIKVEWKMRRNRLTLRPQSWTLRFYHHLCKA